MVKDGEIDIGVTDFFATLSRSQAVDFSTILHYAKSVELYQTYVWILVISLSQDCALC